MALSENPYNNEEFRSFLQPECNRLEWICSWLEKNAIDYAIIPAGSLKHIWIKFPASCYSPDKTASTLLVHYDRIGIGANDNSAAIYQILNFARKLTQEQKKQKHNIRIIFTDGEELGLKNSAESKDKLLLPSILKKNGMANDNFYAIDSCGRGDTIVVSSTGKNCGSREYQNQFNVFFERTIEKVKRSCGQNWITIPTSYGDNASFILLGMKAITITMLPKTEADLYMRTLQKNPLFKTEFVNKCQTEQNKKSLPLTWRMMHTDEDNLENLTTESWKIMEHFLNTLTKN